VANSTLKDMTMPEALDETLVEFPDNRLLIELCGEFDRNLAAFEQGFGVVIMRRGNRRGLGAECALSTAGIRPPDRAGRYRGGDPTGRLANRWTARWAAR
jgi:hypothetical protein